MSDNEAQRLAVPAISPRYKLYNYGKDIYISSCTIGIIEPGEGINCRTVVRHSAACVIVFWRVHFPPSVQVKSKGPRSESRQEHKQKLWIFSSQKMLR